jgi:hypothetical protein
MSYNKILEGNKEMGPTQKRLQEFRNYEKSMKELKKPLASSEEPFVENRHPKVCFCFV